MKVQSVPVGSIKVRGRTRKDMGDVAALAASIERLGLLQPIVVDAKMRLVAGERRLRAVKQLNWGSVRVSIANNLDDAVKLLAAERDENVCRKSFTPGEAVAIGERMEALERPQAEARRRATQNNQSAKARGGNLPQQVSGKTRDLVAAIVGMSGRTYEKAKAVVASGDREIIDEMNETGKVDPAYKKVVHVTNNSGENEWYTPLFYIDAAREVMGSIDCDPASCELAQESIKAGTFFTIEDDGLVHEWNGNVWMNPPYAKDLVSQFADALLSEVDAGRVTQAIVLVNNGTETAWAQQLLTSATAVCFPKGRIKFLDKTGTPANTPLQGQMFCYFGERVEQFVGVFNDFGVCLEVLAG